MTALTETLAERALRPLDQLRGAGLRALAAGGPFARAPVVRAIFYRRSTRVPVLLAVHALAALALAVLAPSVLLVVGPLVLAVPHVAADVRHLVLRRDWPRRWLAGSALLAAGLLASRVLVAVGSRHAPPLVVEQGLGAAWVVFAATVGARSGASRRRGWLVLAGTVAFAALTLAWPRASGLWLLHGHNLVAVVLWVWLFRRGNRLAWLPVAVVLAGAVVLTTGVLIPFTVRHGALSFAGLHLFAAADWLAPGLSDGAAIALTTSFAFLQSAHYAIWLMGVPSGDRPGEGARSLRAAARDFARDFRPAGTLAVVALAAGVAGAGLLHPGRVQHLVLSLGTFHAWLELAVVGYVLAAGSFVPHRVHPAWPRGRDRAKHQEPSQASPKVPCACSSNAPGEAARGSAPERSQNSRTERLGA